MSIPFVSVRDLSAQPGRHSGQGLGPRLRATVAALSMAIVLAGCAVGPDYHTPDETLKPYTHSLPSSAAVGRGAALDQWWTGFDDPMLVSLVKQALAQNLDLAASYARVLQARAAAEGAGANLAPTVDLQAQGSDQRQSQNSSLAQIGHALPGYQQHQKEYVVGPVASWEIDVAGGLRRQAAAARDEVQAAEAQQAGTRVSVAADTADAYIEIRGLQAQIAVTKNQIGIDAHLLDLVQVQQRYGSADQRQYAQAEAVLREARAQLPTLEIALAGQLNRLDVLLGVQPGTYEQQLAAVTPIPRVPSVDAVGAPASLLRQRPDVMAAERRLAASNERIGAALSDYYPKFSLSGLLQFDSGSSNNLFTSASLQPEAILGLQWRLFDFGKVDAEVAQARGANAEALATYRQTVLHAVEDVENAMVSFVQTQSREQELSQEVDALAQAQALSEKAYVAGSIPLTDVLQSQQQQLVARNALAAEQANASRSAVALFRALGGGWGTPQADTTVASRPAS